MIFRTHLVPVVLIALSWFSSPALADAELLAVALTPGSALQSSIDDLEGICARLDRLDGAQPRLPTTRAEETFLRCEMSEGEIGLSYSDGFLALAQLQGPGLVEAMTGDLQDADDLVRYAGLDIYPGTALAVDRINGRAWLLSPAHLHTHLFLFEHPMLMQTAPSSTEGRSDQLLPRGLDIGADLITAGTILSAHCPHYEERHIEPVTLPGGLSEQMQIDCFGLDVAGFPRKAEFVFGDGRLDLIWILTGNEEHARMRGHLTHLYGAPLEESDTYIIWPDGWALRIDVPEIMIASPDVAAALTGR
ncbi:MAG: hypothetical protein Rhims3KO_14590 [Hyphomicrobiales bacterium]